MKIAFYKGKGRLMDSLIRWWTGGKYSHCELLFADGHMFSSDAWTGGVRWNTNYDLSNWDLVEIPCTSAQERTLKAWCADLAGKKYDWLGVLWFVLPFVPESPDKWFCSELCAAGLKIIGKFPYIIPSRKMSPTLLYEFVSVYPKLWSK